MNMCGWVGSWSVGAILCVWRGSELPMLRLWVRGGVGSRPGCDVCFLEGDEKSPCVAVPGPVTGMQRALAWASPAGLGVLF